MAIRLLHKLTEGSVKTRVEQGSVSVDSVYEIVKFPKTNHEICVTYDQGVSHCNRMSSIRLTPSKLASFGRGCFIEWREKREAVLVVQRFGRREEGDLGFEVAKRARVSEAAQKREVKQK
ncbi:hypothetical protein COLO4_29310 [Corchorus olitorius]|uniref:Uncharacterized protein n=1 Tax=Corchorus olitorius TaxID=93759 RepID=A0A1R3HFD9_9ROSI|nr:hypothetical protein COLO4_29310 [Corchorus olitorius]